MTGKKWLVMAASILVMTPAWSDTTSPLTPGTEASRPVPRICPAGEISFAGQCLNRVNAGRPFDAFGADLLIVSPCRDEDLRQVHGCAQVTLKGESSTTATTFKLLDTTCNKPALVKKVLHNCKGGWLTSGSVRHQQEGTQQGKVLGHYAWAYSPSANNKWSLQGKTLIRTTIEGSSGMIVKRLYRSNGSPILESEERVGLPIGSSTSQQTCAATKSAFDLMSWLQSGGSRLFCFAALPDELSLGAGGISGTLYTRQRCNDVFDVVGAVRDWKNKQAYEACVVLGEKLEELAGNIRPPPAPDSVTFADSGSQQRTCPPMTWTSDQNYTNSKGEYCSRAVISTVDQNCNITSTAGEEACMGAGEFESE